MGKSVFLIGNLRPFPNAGERFNNAETELMTRGYTVKNIMRYNDIMYGSDTDRLKLQIDVMRSCDSVYLIPGWMENDDSVFLFMLARRLKYCIAI